MCGIIAHLAFDPSCRIDEPHLKQLNDLLIHRGPDDWGVFLKGDAALSMRRLSIVDLGGGHQPITTADGRYTIVFNGEIYNHEELRQQLVTQGCPMKTRSDTEVLLYAYAAWGKECLNKLNGMFAFAIWDEHIKQLFVARDRMGVKPLYYAINQERVLLASELTPLVKSKYFNLTLDHQSVSNYLAYWYICEPQSIFNEIRQLPAGHCAFIRQGRMETECYWQIPSAKESAISFKDACLQLEELLKDAVHMRLKVDVPIGTFLSGGIDSGLVTAMAAAQIPHRLQSFGIGFKDPSYDETALATQTARRHKVNLDIYKMTQVTPALMEKIISAFDEPLGNASFVPTYLLAQAARSKMKVVLTGDGGDELFGGYPTYQAPYYQRMWQRTPALVRNSVKKAISRMPVSHGRISLDYRLKQLVQGVELDYQQAHYTWRLISGLNTQKQIWQDDILSSLGSYDPFIVAQNHFMQAKNLDVKNQMMYVDLNTYLLNDHLRKVDRMTMAHGLEARIPFMDYRIVEFAMRLPSEYKVNLWQTKKILKTIAKKYLPSAIIKAKKKGLTSPIAGWLSHELKDYAADSLKGGLIATLFKSKEVERLLQEHWDKRKDNSRLLWSLLTLQIWHRQLK